MKDERAEASGLEDHAAFRFVDAGEGRLLALRGDAITLRSTVPSPPGSRREGELLVEALRFKVKIHASRKQPDGTYLLEGRLFDATKAVVAAITRGVEPAV